MSRIKSFNAVIFLVLGVAIVVQTVRYAGIRLEAWTGLLLGAAMIALAIVRMRAWRRQP